MARKSRKQQSPESIAPVEASVRVGMYVRKSVNRENDRRPNETTANQIKIIKEHLEKKCPDCIIVDSYIDEDYSGTNFRRPAFERMIEDIKSKRINCVVVKDLSRLGRNLQETGDYLERVFPLLKVRVIAVGDGYDSVNPLDTGLSLSLPLQNLVNEFYVHDISQKITSTKKLQKSRGEVIGRSPYGYRIENHKLVVDPEAAEYVRLIYQWYLEGKAIGTIVRMLTEMNVTGPKQHYEYTDIPRPPKGKKEWHNGTVSSILANLEYTGAMVYDKARTFMLDGKKHTVTLPEEEWTIVRDNHEAIIPEEIYRQAKAEREARSKRHTKRKSEWKESALPSTPNLFKGRLICGDCGCKMQRGRYKTAGNEQRDTPVYHYMFTCQTYSLKGKTACSSKRIREDTLFSIILNVIKLQVDLAANVKEAVTEAEKTRPRAREIKEMTTKLRDAKNKLQRYQGLLKAAREDLHDGLIDDDAYRSMKLDYESKVKEEKENIATLETKLEVERSLHYRNEWVEEYSRFYEIKELSAEMLDALISSITIYDEQRVDVKMKYRDAFIEAMTRIHKEDIAKETAREEVGAS